MRRKAGEDYATGLLVEARNLSEKSTAGSLEVGLFVVLHN
jgi:hypothetical protein